MGRRVNCGRSPHSDFSRGVKTGKAHSVPIRRSRLEVPAKAHGFPKFIVWWIDAVGGWRYSQAQIPDLVAYAITRFRKAAQSFGSALPRVRRFPVKSGAAQQCDPSGAKAPVHSRLFAARLKSCPFKADNFTSTSQLQSCPFKADKSASTSQLQSCPFKADKFTSTSQRRIGGHRNL
jgi:hypothetical protein